MTIGQPNPPKELVLLLVLSTLWGASYSLIKVAVHSIPPVTLIAARTLIAGAILFACVRWRGLTLPKQAITWRRFLFQACLNSVIPFTLIAWAQQTTDAALATILNSTSPIFAFLLTVFVTRHEVVTGRKLFGVGAGIVGICLIVGCSVVSAESCGRNSPSSPLPSAMPAPRFSARISRGSIPSCRRRAR